MAITKGARVKYTQRNGSEIKGRVSGSRSGQKGDFVEVTYKDDKGREKIVCARESQLKKY